LFVQKLTFNIALSVPEQRWPNRTITSCNR